MIFMVSTFITISFCIISFLHFNSALKLRGVHVSKAHIFQKKQCLEASRSTTGFGFAKPSNSSLAINESEIKVKNDNCSCDSGKLYSNCCGLIHSLPQVSRSSIDSPDQLVRARYSAYALGIPDFIISTTHSSNKEYRKHFPDLNMFNSRNSRESLKAIKKWRKDLIQYNSEYFEFLRFYLISTNDSEDLRYLSEKTQVPDDGKLNSVKFRIILRERVSGNLVPFEELSAIICVKDRDHILSKEKPPDCWYYSYGEVRPIEEDELKKLSSELPSYRTINSIKDRW